MSNQLDMDLAINLKWAKNRPNQACARNALARSKMHRIGPNRFQSVRKSLEERLNFLKIFEKSCNHEIFWHTGGPFPKTRKKAKMGYFRIPKAFSGNIFQKIHFSQITPQTHRNKAMEADFWFSRFFWPQADFGPLGGGPIFGISAKIAQIEGVREMLWLAQKCTELAQIGFKMSARVWRRD